MTIVGQVLSALLYLFLLLMIGRMVFDILQQFARDWSPRGPVLVIAEVVYTITDPPLKLLRRFIPPVRLGNVALDLSFLVLFLAVGLLINIVRTL